MDPPRIFFILSFLTLFGVSVTWGQSATTTPATLGEMYVYRDKITLSGFSSGGTFAQMLQFSYSSMFAGIAVFSHTYYRCGLPDGNQTSYDSLCTKLFNFTEDQFYDVNRVHDDIKDYYRRKVIENPYNLRNKRLYVYTGLRNALFTPRQSLNVLSVYEPYIQSMESIYSRVQDANLVMPTDNTNFGAPCTELNENQMFIGRCGFSGATEAINFLLFYKQNTSREAFVRQSTTRGKVLEFNQKEFTRGLQNHQMDDIGYYYVPRRCKNGYYNDRPCYLHFYFHGCLTGRLIVNSSAHVENTGMLEVAERKGIIMIFPQAAPSLPNNDIGCWDTFGISGPDYATQRGAQLRVVKRILDRVLGKSSSSSLTGSFFPGSSSSSSSYNKGNGHNHYNQNRQQRPIVNYYPKGYGGNKYRSRNGRQNQQASFNPSQLHLPELMQY